MANVNAEKWFYKLSDAGWRERRGPKTNFCSEPVRKKNELQRKPCLEWGQ